MARKFVPKWWQTLSDPCSTFYLAFFMILFDLFDMTLYLYAMFVIELWKRKLKLLNKKFKKSRLESLNPGNFRALECQYSGMSLSLPLSWHAQLLKLIFSNILLSRCPIRETASPLSHLSRAKLNFSRVSSILLLLFSGFAKIKKKLCQTWNLLKTSRGSDDDDELWQRPSKYFRVISSSLHTFHWENGKTQSLTWSLTLSLTWSLPLSLTLSLTWSLTWSLT